jgi:TPR repeat protein
MYHEGQGVPQDDAESLRWLHKAAEQGDADAQSLLGAMYANGRGLPRDDVEAVRWWRKVAEQGNANAQAKLGIMYTKGRGVPKDYVQAYMWLNLAAAGEEEGAAQLRDSLEHRMTSAQIAVAQKRTAAWRPTRSGAQ